MGGPLVPFSPTFITVAKLNIKFSLKQERLYTILRLIRGQCGWGAFPKIVYVTKTFFFFE